MALKTLKAVAPNPSIKITFFRAKPRQERHYTLSFPTAQRWDFRIVDAAGKAIYVYSDNCEFEQKVGESMVNNDDKLVYTETVDFDDLSPNPWHREFKRSETILANYPGDAPRLSLGAATVRCCARSYGCGSGSEFSGGGAAMVPGRGTGIILVVVGGAGGDLSSAGMSRKGTGL